MDVRTSLWTSKSLFPAPGVRRTSRVAAPVLGTLVAAVAASARADDGPQWRGPQRNGVSAETGLLRAWPKARPQLAWKATGLGTGYASVVVRRGRVFTLGRQGSRVVVTAQAAGTGK